MFAKGKAGEEMHDVRAALAGDSHCSKVAAGGAQPHRQVSCWNSTANRAGQMDPCRRQDRGCEVARGVSSGALPAPGMVRSGLGSAAPLCSPGNVQVN